MNTINPLSTVYSPATAPRSSGASSFSTPAPAATGGAAAASPDPGEAQALQGASASGDAAQAGRSKRGGSAESLQSELDTVMKDVQTSLRFRVDDEADRVVVSVVDRGSGDVIYQIPSDVALRIAKRMAELGSGMINETA